VLRAKQIVKAIGQNRPSIALMLGVGTERGLIAVNGGLETSVPGIFAGGDCIRLKGAASTVMAVQDGKLAARSIHEKVMANG
jgi:dihydropyrimidine dehydrogenase (NAD+) subunit PreT